MAAQETVARSNFEWFIVRELGDEALVYDLRNQRVTSLNPFAAAVWRACDGSRTPGRIAEEMRRAGIAVADKRAVVLALKMLAEAGLVEMVSGDPAVPNLSDRRGFLRSVFGGGAAMAAAATPAVVSILAPTPAQAASSVCGDCPEDKPLCNEGTGRCVQCLIDDNCEEFNFEFCDNNECWGPF